MTEKFPGHDHFHLRGFAALVFKKNLKFLRKTLNEDIYYKMKISKT